jgi:hypothetical protein
MHFLSTVAAGGGDATYPLRMDQAEIAPSPENCAADGSFAHGATGARVAPPPGMPPADGEHVTREQLARVSDATSGRSDDGSERAWRRRSPSGPTGCTASTSSACAS